MTNSEGGRTMNNGEQERGKRQPRISRATEPGNPLARKCCQFTKSLSCCNTSAALLRNAKFLVRLLQNGNCSKTVSVTYDLYSGKASASKRKIVFKSKYEYDFVLGCGRFARV